MSALCALCVFANNNLKTKLNTVELAISTSNMHCESNLAEEVLLAFHTWNKTETGHFTWQVLQFQTWRENRSDASEWCFHLRGGKQEIAAPEPSQCTKKTCKEPQKLSINMTPNLLCKIWSGFKPVKQHKSKSNFTLITLCNWFTNVTDYNSLYFVIKWRDDFTFNSSTLSSVCTQKNSQIKSIFLYTYIWTDLCHQQVFSMSTVCQNSNTLQPQCTCWQHLTHNSTHHKGSFSAVQ